MRIIVIFLTIILTLFISGCAKRSVGNAPVTEQPATEELKQIEKDGRSKTDEQDEKIATSTDGIDTGSWKTYRNEMYAFKIEYPKLLSHQGREGSRIYFYDDNKYYTLHLEVINKPIDIDNIQGLYGPVDPQLIEGIYIGSIKSYRFHDGDMGCGGNDYRLPLSNKDTLRIFFVSCNGREFGNENEILSSFQIIN